MVHTSHKITCLIITYRSTVRLYTILKRNELLKDRTGIKEENRKKFMNECPYIARTEKRLKMGKKEEKKIKKFLHFMLILCILSSL